MIALIAVTHATEEPPVPTEQTSQQLANQQTDPIRLGLEEWVHNLRERIAELTLENDEENARQPENDRLYGRSRDNDPEKVRKQDRMDRLMNAKRDLYAAEEALRKKEWAHNLRKRIAELNLENDEENERQRENDRLYGRSRDNYQDKVRKQDRMDRLRNAKRDLYEAEEALRKFDQAAQSRQHP